MAIDHGYNRLYRNSALERNKTGLIYEHQIVAERKLGRPLKKGEVVHHIDHNKQNNDEDNLLVFASNSDHSAFHKQGEVTYYIDLEGVAYCDPLSRSNGKYIRTAKCVICGKPIGRRYKYCVECGHDMQRKVPKMPREELKHLIRTKSFMEIGRMFDVDGNAIKRHCKNAGLPFRKKDINQFSDEEWENI